MPAIDEALTKFHASLNVSSLDRAIPFYRVLLGAEPAKVRPDYAKFDLAEPPLVLSLIPGKPAAGGHLNHVGLRVRTAEELVAVQRRLEAAGMRTQREEGVECCYARQTKFWITDPDGALWEIYVFHDDIEEHGHGAPPRAQQLPVQQPEDPAPGLSWHHRLSDPFPAAVPHEDGTLAAVHLEGSINAAPDAPHRNGVMSEVLRALRPSGLVHLHGLVGDRQCAAPTLPGPAAAVRHVPAIGDVLDELARAGFVDVGIETLTNPWFVIDGVALRELRVVAKKGGAAAASPAGQRPPAAARQESACCSDKPAAAQPVALVR